MILNKRAIPSPFTIYVVKHILQGSESKLKISYSEDLEEADILTTLYTSIHAMNSTIRQYQQKEKGSDDATGCICESC